MRSKQYFIVIFIITLLAFFLRLAIFLPSLQTPSRLSRPDTAGYLIPAHALAERSEYPTTRRPPGYPLLAAMIFRCGGGERALGVAGIIFSGLITAIIGVAAWLYSNDRKCGVAAALLYSLNLTSIANSGLLLSDTFFAFFAALQFLFFVLFCKNRNWKYFLATTLIAALGTLIRPVNLLFILPLLFLLAVNKNLHRQKKIVLGTVAAAVFVITLCPWMYRNYLCGAPWCIDTNTGAMRHQNGAMLMAEVKGTDFESEKKLLLEEEKKVFADQHLYPDERSREKWRTEQFRMMVSKHFFTYLRQHFAPQILLPDLPSFFEVTGITRGERGTMGVLKKDGIFAALKHYFGARYWFFLLIALPLLIPVLVMYLGVLWKVILDIKKLKKYYFELLILLAFGEYYLFLPGAITAPRYQLPALPVLCTLGGCAIISMICHDKNKNDSSAGV